MIEYDLHIHSNASDGVLNPEQIFKIAREMKLRGISITDHDTVDSLGSGRNLSQKYDVDFIPGIELSTDYHGCEVHILGYYIDYNNKEFLEKLEHFSDERYTRINKILNKLTSLGYEICLEEVLKESGPDIHSLGRPHIARVLVKKRYFNDVRSVFDELLGYGKPGYVERYKTPTKEGICLIKKYGGVPVVAHPYKVDNLNVTMDLFLKELIDFGIEGIEVYHSDQDAAQSFQLMTFCKNSNLIITGGSDYHEGNYLGKYYIGSAGVSSDDVHKLKGYK